MVVEEMAGTTIERFRSQVYTVNDFVGWNDRKELILSPNFQRRKVWKPQGKSYLIDTIVRGMPIPPIFMREIVHPRERRTVREVVDGQQRLSAILDFIDGKFTVLPSHNPHIARRKYETLPESVQRTILSFPLSVNIITASSDAEILEIFSRINSYSITLNPTEKLNAEYTGAFKEAMHRLARKHLAYWSNHLILTSMRIARMEDVDLTSDLVVTMMTKLSSGKGHIAPFYKKYDDDFPQEAVMAYQFDQVLSLVEKTVGEDIEKTNFRRLPLFYSLFTAIYDTIFGFGSLSNTPEKTLNEEGSVEVNASLQELNEIVEERVLDSVFGEFVRATTRNTTSLPQRTLRHETLKEIIHPAFE